MKITKCLLVILVVFPALIVCFPDGAPVDACVKSRPNQPYHGQATPQSPDSNPYTIIASDSSYTPGSKISVVISGSTFRGFFMQARDVKTGQWIGSWDIAPNTSDLPECSAITHADNRDKVEATLVWTAPNDTPGGQVYFTGSVVKNYATFWTDLVASVA